MSNYILGQALGYITAGINFILFIPQVIHVYNVKDTHSINTNFILLQILSCVSTLSYAVVIYQPPLMVSSVSILISSSLLGYAKWVLFKTPNISGRYEYIPINPLKSSDFKKIPVQENNINL